MIGPVVYTLLALIVAGIVHLSTVLAMPWVATRDGFQRLNGLVRDNEMSVIAPADLRDTLPFADPAVALAACRYVLDKGPVRVRLATGSAPIAVIFLRKGTGIFQSLTDRAATQGILDVVIATADQMAKITALESDDELVQGLRIVSADDIGMVRVRGLVPTPSQRADIERQIRSTTCEQETLDK